MVAKLESRVKELESEMDGEQRRLGDATKNFRKADRGIKEYTFRQEEDRKNAERMQDLVDKLQNQVRTNLRPECRLHSHADFPLRCATTRSRSRRPRRSPP